MKYLGNKEELKEIEWAFRNFIPKGLTLIAGNPGSGKSLLSIYLALLAKNKVDFDVFEVGNVKEVYYVDGENSYDELNRRACLIMDRLGLKDMIVYTDKIEDVYNKKDSFTVIDNVLSFNEIDFKRLRDNYVILVHHLNKKNEIYGSVKIPAFVDVVYLIESLNNKYFRIKKVKDRFGKCINRLSLKFSGIFEIVSGFVSVKISEEVKKMLPKNYNEYIEKLLEKVELSGIEGRTIGRTKGRSEVIKIREDLYNKILKLKGNKSFDEFFRMVCKV